MKKYHISEFTDKEILKIVLDTVGYDNYFGFLRRLQKILKDMNLEIQKEERGQN